MRFWKIAVILLSLLAFAVVLDYDSKHNNEIIVPQNIVETPAAESKALSARVICLDPGHGNNITSEMEPLAPDSKEKKRAYVHGSHGERQSELAFNLRLAKLIETKLTELGASVHLTRTTNDTNMSNVERAKFANNLNADISISIHADGNNDKDVSGMRMIVPSNNNLKNDEVYSKSKEAGEIIFNSVISATDAKSRGVVERDTLPSFNWSEVPTILFEAGCLTNEDDDKMLDDDEYLNKIADGIVDGLIKYFEKSGTN